MQPEPQSYLSESGVEIFHEICKHLEDADALMDVDSYGISMMAHWLDLYLVNAEKTKINGGVQVYKTGAEGVSASLTVMKTAHTAFKDLSSKFGLSNKDRELMMKFKVKRRETDDMDKL